MGISAFRFILLLGVVSLFADVTYEGAAGIIGPYLSHLGASGAAVGVIVGIGELLGYAFRGASGFFADRTQRYWTLTFVGYAINLISVPLLALASHWQTAAFLIILERVGKAIRVPARDAMISFASKQTGRGWGFGVHEALDRVGSVAGPFFLAVLLYRQGSYQEGFALLAIPAGLALGVLWIAKLRFPEPEKLEIKQLSLEPRGFSRFYWIYLAGAGFAALGFTSFALIAYHLNKAGIIPTAGIPLLYAMSNAVGAIGSLVMGRLFDRKGISFLALVTASASLFAPLVFFGSSSPIAIGMVLWGIGSASQKSILRAVVAHLAAPERRGAAYGILNLLLGIAGALGSALMGLLYDVSLAGLTAFCLASQLLAVLLFLKLSGKFT